MLESAESRWQLGSLLRRLQGERLAPSCGTDQPFAHSATDCRTIWISDTHLGTPGCKAPWLLDFLRNHHAETIYLVGDIIDGWQLRKEWYWDETQHEVLKLLFERARTGTRVVFIPGNHDEFARDFLGITFGCIEVHSEAIHATLAGKRYLITHGDQFDGIVQHAKWLAFLGDNLYCLILRLNHWLNRLRRRLGMRYWSLSQYLKHKVKNAVSFISDFEHALADEARRRGFDGVVCGHIHRAEIRQIGQLQYVNCGDWVESLTAVLEDRHGQMQLVTWDDIKGDPGRLPNLSKRPSTERERPVCVRGESQALI